MILYEVNIELDAEEEKAYCEWIHPHIEKILILPGFIKAKFFKQVPMDTQLKKDEFVHFTIHYILEEWQYLENYLLHHAAELREDAYKKFPGKFRATRRAFELVSAFHK